MGLQTIGATGTYSTFNTYSILQTTIGQLNFFRWAINYDIIILDEAQDINPTFYELICKIYADNNIYAYICEKIKCVYSKIYKFVYTVSF